MNENEKKMPSVFSPPILIVVIILSVLGSIIGLELITRVGTTPNTSIIGAVIAIVLARIPISFFMRFRDVNSQNLIQTAISGSTFSAANALMLPIGIPFLLGKPELVLPMLIGVALSLFADGTNIYRIYDSEIFPDKNEWPPGIATAEAIKAAASDSKSGKLLGIGILLGGVGKWLGIPMDLFGVGFIGNFFALTAFALGLLLRGYGSRWFGIDINELYVPHGIMIGAGLVALIQIIQIIVKQKKSEANRKDGTEVYSCSPAQLRKGLWQGYGMFLVIAIILAAITGLITEMSVPMLILWIFFAAVAAIVSELIVGISAMYSGWFPAFATALIFLVLGMLIGFPPTALAVLVGFTASTGPAFADMAYDFKAGSLLRGAGRNTAIEKEGRKQQYFAELIGFIVAIITVLLVHQRYFEQDLFAPVSRTYVTTIQAGTDSTILIKLIIFAVVGGIIQLIGGSKKQIGILFATGLLINFGLAGITVLISLAVRGILLKILGKEKESQLYILGAGFITGSALYSFYLSTMGAIKK